MHRPYHQAVTSSRFQLIKVVLHPWQCGGLTRLVFSGADIGCRDLRKWRYFSAVCAAPETGMGDVDSVMRIDRDADSIDTGAAALD